MDLMLDTETLGTRPGCVVMSVALVTVDEKMTSFTKNISVSDQGTHGLVIDPLTQAWWDAQPASTYEACRAGASDLRSVLKSVNEWIIQTGRLERLWCHGAGFDAPIVEELYWRARVPCPWRYWTVRDTRTAYDLAGVDLKFYRSGVHHSALDDAKSQVAALLESFRILRI